MDDSSLSMWMRALIGYVRSGQPDLTNRQMALMLLVYLTPGPHTVRGLASIPGVSICAFSADGPRSRRENTAKSRVIHLDRQLSRHLVII